MRAICEEANVYLWLGGMDMRCSFDRLSSFISEAFKRSPIEGGFYVFFSRSKSKVKILYWDDDGMALWYKRLEAGTFRIKSEKDREEITGVDLRKLLCGIDLSRIKMQKRG